MDEITKDELDAPQTGSDVADEASVDENMTEAVENTEPPANDLPITEESDKDGNEIDYDKVIEEDLSVLRSEFPELAGLGDITELDNPIRYAALRDLGLSAAEAYLATAKRARRDNRSHLTTAYGKNATPPTSLMSQRELSAARELFGNLSDLEIQRLYKRVKERS